jgi:putative drug exporter of the RND superfamily
MHRITRRLGDASARRPKRVVVLWLVALVAFGVLSGAAGGTAVDDFVASGSQSEQAQKLLAERFPDAANGRALAVFAVPAGDSLEAHSASIAAALDEVGDVDGVVDVRDPFAGSTISDDGRVGYATITFDKPNTRVGKPAIASLGEALAAARDDGLVAEVGGDAAFVNSDINEPSGAEAVGILAALVILVVAFGAVVAAVVPIVLALVAVGIGLSGVLLAAAVLDVSTAAPTIGAMVGLGVGIDYALLVVSRYRENRRAGQDNRTALSDAMATVGSSVVFRRRHRRAGDARPPAHRRRVPREHRCLRRLHRRRLRRRSGHAAPRPADAARRPHRPGSPAPARPRGQAHAGRSRTRSGGASPTGSPAARGRG